MFRPAERKRAFLKIGIFGPAGSGKTASSLLIAYGITKDWSKIGLVDTENGSGELYAGSTIGGVTIGQYQVARISHPFEPAKYIAAINAAVKGGLEVLILDSISHAWAGEGGLLDLQGKVTSKVGNSYTAWREVTPLHNKFVEAMLQSKIHLIATLRAKQEYILEQNDKGKMAPRKVGLAPIQRDGMEYEFTTVFSIGGDHIATAEKDRTNLFDGKYFVPGPETGEAFKAWLEAAPPAAASAEAPDADISELEKERLEEPPAPTDKAETPEPPAEKPVKPTEPATPEPPKGEKKRSTKKAPATTATVVVMEKPVEVEGGYQMKVLVTEPSEAAYKPLTLINPTAYDEGQALIVSGAIKGDIFIAESVSLVGDEPAKDKVSSTEIVQVLTNPKTNTFEVNGQKQKLPWAYVEARDGGEYAIVGECVSEFKSGDTLEVAVTSEQTKGRGTLLFIEKATQVAQAS